MKRVRGAIHYQHPQAPVRLLADREIPRVARAMLQTLKYVRRSFDKKRAAHMIAGGHYAEVASLIDLPHHHEVMRRPLGLLGKVWHDGARIGARKINGSFTSRRRVVRYHKAKDSPIPANGSLEDYLLAHAVAKDAADLFDFDMFDPVTETVIRNYQDALITALNADQRAVVNSIIVDGLRTGETPEEIADDLALVIGLTPAQARAVQNFREALSTAERYQNLDSPLLPVAVADAAAQAADDGQPMDDASVDDAVGAYASRQLAYRAQVIATTETTRAASLGLQGAYLQAVDRGVMPMEAVTQRWQISLDEKTCPLCLSIVDRNPDGVGLDEQFDSEDGPIDGPPAHPSCRCSIEIVTNLDLVPDDEEASMDFALRLRKYSEDEARDDHGKWTSGGGGGGSAQKEPGNGARIGASGAPEGPPLTRAQERFMAKDWSVDADWDNYQFTAREIMKGVSRDAFLASAGGDKTMEKFAGGFYDRTMASMGAINSGPDIPTPVYRGITAGEDYKVGDRFSESLSSWTGDRALADQFATGKMGTRGGPEGAGHVPAIFDDISSTNSKGFNLSDRMTTAMFEGNDHKEEIYRGAQEWLTSGQYEVKAINEVGGVRQISVERVGPAQTANVRKEYSEDEPRDDHGRWSSGGGGGLAQTGDLGRGAEFFSGNVDDLSFGDAVSRLSSPGQARVEAMSHEVDHALGLKAGDTSVVGAWSDGAENSVMTTIEGASWDQLRLSAAMKGSLADQKAVLAFREGEGGDSLLEFHASGSLDDIHAGLLKDGLAFHTLIPTSSGARVIVVASSEEDADNVAKAAGRYGANVSFRQGQAEFIGVGGDGTREQAQQAYQGVIDGSGVPGAGAVWQGLRDRWAGLAVAAKRLLAWVVAA